MKNRKFWLCRYDRHGQRTGDYYSMLLPEILTTKRDGLLWLAVDNVHESGYIQTAGTALLHTSEESAQRAAQS